MKLVMTKVPVIPLYNIAVVYLLQGVGEGEKEVGERGEKEREREREKEGREREIERGREKGQGNVRARINQHPSVYRRVQAGCYLERRH